MAINRGSTPDEFQFPECDLTDKHDWKPQKLWGLDLGRVSGIILESRYVIGKEVNDTNQLFRCAMCGIESHGVPPDDLWMQAV